MMLLGHGRSVCDGLAVALGVVERDQNLLIQRARKIGCDCFWQFEGGASEFSKPTWQDRLEYDPHQQKHKRDSNRQEQQFQPDAVWASVLEPFPDTEDY